MLEDIGNLDFDSNTFVLKIKGGKFNQKIKPSDLTLSEEISQYVKVSEVKVNKDGTEVSVTLERTNTNYDDFQECNVIGNYFDEQFFGGRELVFI